MNAKLYSTFLLLLTFLLCACNQNDGVTIDNLEAGTLASRIPTDQMMSIKSLTISGELNGTDIRVIREMATKGLLTSLDIEETDIVAGGEQYYTDPKYPNDKYFTKNNEIGRRMFFDCNITQFKLPTSVVEIEEYSFSKTDIETITIPKCCKRVSYHVFEDCPKLKSIHLLEDSVEWNGDNNFNCPAFVEFTVDRHNPYLMAKGGILYSKDGSRLISCPPALTQADILSNVKNIEKYAFSHSEGLTQLTIPSSVQEIGFAAFEYCKNIKTITLSDSITCIQPDAFIGCSQLESLYLGKKATDISFDPLPIAVLNPFGHTPPLFKISVNPENPRFMSKDGILYTKDGRTLLACPRKVTPRKEHFNGVNTLGCFAFAGNEHLDSLYLPSSIHKVDGFCFYHSNLKHIELSNREIFIEKLAFDKCDSLESLEFPEGMENIICKVYSCDNLNSIYFPSSAKAIDLVLRHCPSVKLIKCLVKTPKEVISEPALKGISDSCTWIVPKGAAKSYKDCNWWRSSWKIREL